MRQRSFLAENESHAASHCQSRETTPNFQEKAEIAATGALSRLYGSIFTTVPKDEQQQMRKQTFNAIWGCARGPKSPTALATILVQGHRVDIIQFLRYEALITFDWFMRNSPSF